MRERNVLKGARRVVCRHTYLPRLTEWPFSKCIHMKIAYANSAIYYYAAALGHNGITEAKDGYIGMRMMFDLIYVTRHEAFDYIININYRAWRERFRRFMRASLLYSQSPARF